LPRSSSSSNAADNFLLEFFTRGQYWEHWKPSEACARGRFESNGRTSTPWTQTRGQARQIVIRFVTELTRLRQLRKSGERDHQNENRF